MQICDLHKSLMPDRKIMRTRQKGLMDRITVITVCYNESPQRISYTLDSIVKQTYAVVELVIMDGGSKDDTIAAIKHYITHITTFVSEPDHGIYDAMNKGIRLSTGEWIIFMNVGDRFHHQDVLTSMMSNSDINDLDMIYGDILRNGREISSAPSCLSRRYLYNQAICHQAMLVRRRAFDLMGAFDISFRLIADRDWVLRFVNSGYAYAHGPAAVCDWENGGTSSDYITHGEEEHAYHLKYFSFLERKVYGTLWVVIKVLRRIRSLNFSVPVRVRDRF
jgi:glycosyltransferase